MPASPSASTPSRTQHTFTGGPKTPAAARRFATTAVGTLLGSRITGSLCDDVELVVSELVTNAVRAGSPHVDVSIALENSCIAVRVTDEAAGWPVERIAGMHDAGGRGLTLVGAMSAAWGVHETGAGKVVWAEIAVHQPRTGR